MSDLNTPPKNNLAENETAPGTMPVTILLLIGGLLLTSAMMVNYTLSTNGTATFNTSALTEKWKAKLPSKENIIKASTSLRKTKKPPPVQWPELTLTGFGTGLGGKDGFAFINGESVVPDQQIDIAQEQVKIIRIEKQGVLVEYKGEMKLLTVKQTIQTLEPF